MHFWHYVRAALSFGFRWDLRCKKKLSHLRAAVRTFVLRRTEYPLQSVGNRSAGFTVSQAIPAVVYQVWVADAFGRTHASGIRRFRGLNPELSFVLFSHEEADNYMNSVWGSEVIGEIYAKSRFGPMRADIFRYCLLFDRGGYYFDVDTWCSVPIRSLHSPSDRRLLCFESGHCSIMPDLVAARCFQCPDRYVAMWGFGFAPKDPILKRVIENISAYYPLFRGKVFPSPKAAILSFTGPGMFTKSVREVVQAEGCLEGAQAGIEFHGHGITWMAGSEIRFQLSPSYVLARDQVIVE